MTIPPFEEVPALEESVGPHTERQRLEAIAEDSWYGKGVNALTIRYSFRIFSRHWRKGTCLELGPAEGLMTDELARHFSALTVVEGAAPFCENLRKRHPSVKVVHSLFEDYRPEGTFDNIVLGHVLEHVADPVALLRKVAGWLAPNSRVFAAVPNARSIHRQMAVLMGILESEHSLNATDLHHGHRRVYDPESLRGDFLKAGLRAEVFGGYWLKPLSNAQLDATWDEPMLLAAMEVGERYPDVAAEIYVVAGRDR